MKRSIILFGMALFLAACDSGPTADGPRAGGEDFPNTVQALGRTLALGADSSKQWNSLDSADVGISGDAPLSDTAKLVAARSLVCNDGSYDGLLGGLPVRYFKVDNKCGLLGSVRDSIVVGLIDNPSGSKDTALYFMSVDSQLLRYQKLTTITDADGDGLILLRNDPGKVNLMERTTAGLWTAYTRMLMDPGPDGLYDPGADNRVYSGSRTLVRLQDTIAHETFDPYVAGQPVLSGTSDSSLVRVVKTRNSAFRKRTEFGLIMAFRDTTHNYPAFFRTHTAWTGGAVRDELVFGSRTDSMFHGGDSVTVIDRAKVGVDTSRIEVRAIMSKTLSDRSGDSLLSVRAERYRSGLFERHSVWQFVSDTPMANGSDPQSGKLSARVDFSNGQWISFEGQLTLISFTGTYMTPTDTATIVVDRHGKVLSITRK